MTKNQKIYLFTAIVVVIAAQLLTHTYRPYVYQNNINDFGFADTIGSLASVIGACCLFWGIKSYSNKDKNRQIIFATLIYTVIWEPLGVLGIHGTFDWKDLIAGLISGAIAWFLKELIERDRRKIKSSYLINEN